MATPRDLLERFWEKVNRTEDHWLWTAGTSGGYGQFWITPSVSIQAYKFAWELENDAVPAGFELDHICRTRLCVRPSHLRVVTGKQNQENQPAISNRGASRYRGVYWDKQTGRWGVQVTHNGKRYRGGRFDDEDEAGEAARLLRNELYTHNDDDRVLYDRVFLLNQV